jgi:hypothetical protein
MRVAGMRLLFIWILGLTCLSAFSQNKKIKINKRNFKIVFMVCSDGRTDNMLETYNNFYFSSNCDSSVSVKVKMSNKELEKIYLKCDSIHFENYPFRFEPSKKSEILTKKDSVIELQWFQDSIKQSIAFPDRPLVRQSSAMSVEPCWRNYLTTDLNGNKKSVTWHDCNYASLEQMNKETIALVQLQQMIFDIIDKNKQINKVRWRRCASL